jgi:hypothetical protein
LRPEGSGDHQKPATGDRALAHEHASIGQLSSRSDQALGLCSGLKCAMFQDKELW